MSQLTIRNLTSAQTELKVIERAQALPKIDNGTGISNLTKNFTNLLSNTTATSQVAPVVLNFVAQYVSIPIAPFETRKTDVQVNANEVLRLTFETEGQRYQVSTPCSSERSTVLAALSPDPKREYTAIYITEHSHLSLFSSAKLGSWMSEFQDKTPLSALSIPGTHNSPTYHTALPSVRCQVVNVQEQLENGVRFLDIRLSPQYPDDPSKDTLALVHGAFPVALTGNRYFRDLVEVVKAFLVANPSETVLMSLKREGVIKATDAQLSKILRDHYITSSDLWYTEPRIPNLGEARSKIVLIRRFHMDPDLARNENGGVGWGIDGSSWPDNCQDGLCASGDIRVQDFYEVEETINIDKKITYSEAQLARSASVVCPLPSSMPAANVETTKQALFINFLSASNFFRPGCWPDKIAAKVNPHIIDFLCRKHNEPEDGKEVGDGCTGIVVCDWVGNGGDWDLVRCIVGHNAKLELREKTTT